MVVDEKCQSNCGEEPTYYWLNDIKGQHKFRKCITFTVPFNML